MPSQTVLTKREFLEEFDIIEEVFQNLIKEQTIFLETETGHIVFDEKKLQNFLDTFHRR